MRWVGRERLKKAFRDLLADYLLVVGAADRAGHKLIELRGCELQVIPYPGGGAGRQVASVLLWSVDGEKLLAFQDIPRDSLFAGAKVEADFPLEGTRYRSVVNVEEAHASGSGG